MPYKNIHFAKLQKRLLNDHRFYMMTERSQLNYLRFVMLACHSENQVTKNIEVLRLAFRTTQTPGELKGSIFEIKRNFPKFKSTKHFYYFEDFNEHTNWVKKELPGNSQGTPRELVETDKETDKDKDQDNWLGFFKDDEEKAIRFWISQTLGHSVGSQANDENYEFVVSEVNKSKGVKKRCAYAIGIAKKLNGVRV